MKNLNVLRISFLLFSMPSKPVNIILTIKTVIKIKIIKNAEKCTKIQFFEMNNICQFGWAISQELLMLQR